MEEYSEIKTKQYRGQGFMTISKYSNDGKMLYIGDKDSKIITSINTKDYSIERIFEGHGGIVWNLDISYNNLILITASGDLSIRFFDIITGNLLYKTDERAIPKYICTQKDNLKKTNFVAIICEALTKKSSTYITIYDLDKIILGDFIEYMRIDWVSIIPTNKPTVLEWTDSNLIVGCDDGQIVIINLIQNKVVLSKQIHSGSIKSIVLNKNKTGILTGSIDSTAKYLLIDTLEQINEYKSTVPINWACWNHNEKKVLIGGGIEAMNVAKTLSNDLNLKVYRTNDQKLVGHLGSHFGPIRYIGINPCGKNYASASQDGSVKIYLIDENEELKELDKQKDPTKIYLIDETNKMFNLTWKPSKNHVLVQNNSKTHTQTQIQTKWIPGMPKPTTHIDSFVVKNFVERSDRVENEPQCTIRITNLPRSTNSKQLYELFDLYGRINGDIRGVRIIHYDDATMAFINYEYPESVHKAIDRMDGYPIDHHIIKVEIAKPRN